MKLTVLLLTLTFGALASAKTLGSIRDAQSISCVSKHDDSFFWVSFPDLKAGNAGERDYGPITYFYSEDGVTYRDRRTVSEPLQAKFLFGSTEALLLFNDDGSPIAFFEFTISGEPKGGERGSFYKPNADPDSFTYECDFMSEK